ncbi:MAG: HNH endonuclease [Bacteroidales bacterium]
MKINYKEDYKSIQWQKRRLDILSRAGFKCELCGCDNEQLHVHHKYYTEGNRIWEYDDRCLIALCESCHTEEHECDRSLYQLIKYLKEDSANAGFTTSDLFNFFQTVRDDLDYYTCEGGNGANTGNAIIGYILKEFIKIHNDHKQK